MREEVLHGRPPQDDLTPEEVRVAGVIPHSLDDLQLRPVGNRLSTTVDGVTTNYAFNALDQLLSAGSAAFTYDARGNLVQVVDGLDTTAYAFDALDRLAGSILPDGTALSYVYDADGRRVQQEVAGSITNFIWDEASPYGDVVLETDAGGATLAAYVLGGTELLSQDRGGV